MTSEIEATGTTRHLATVETITEIAAIPGADAIVRARVRGWDVVVRLDEFRVGDRCVYFEIDSLLDVADPRFEFLAARGVRTTVDGRRGHVLKTAKLRGQYSQGLALPVSAFPELGEAGVGQDVTATLAVVKWEPPIPVELAGEVLGPRPSWIPMTDEERIQNIPEILDATAAWVATEKIDGTSSTYYIDGTSDDRGVCGRNWDLVASDSSTLWRLARAHDVHELMAATWPGSRAAVQGEVYGEGVQGNPLKLRGQHLGVFTILVDGAELPRDAWPAWALELAVPVRPELAFPASVEQALADVDTLGSAVAPGRPAEGVVWRATDVATVVLPAGATARASFKVVANGYLLKHDR
jgi:RNA ligase (TIGR02306 family)